MGFAANEDLFCIKVRRGKSERAFFEDDQHRDGELFGLVGFVFNLCIFLK